MGYFYRSKPRNDGKNLRSDQATTHRWYFFRRFKDYIKKVQFNDEVMNTAFIRLTALGAY